MRKRNCAISELQVTHFSVCGSRNLCLSIFLVQRRNCGNSSQGIVHVCKRNCRISNHIIVSVRKRNFKAHNILYVESLWFLMQESEEPGSAWPKVPMSKPSWRCCSQLCHLGWDCFSLLRSYQAWSNQLTCYEDPDIRQTSRPKTAGTKLPKGPIRWYVQQHSFVEIWHEIISTAILSLPLIQEGQLSVTGERMCTTYWLTA